MKLVFDWCIFIRVIFSSAYDAEFNTKVALKKLLRPFQSLQHAKRTYREIKLLKMMNHENVSGAFSVLITTNSLMLIYIHFPMAHT